MSDYDGTIFFKDWLPDQPDLNNPGLIEAKNAVPFSGTYQSFLPLSNTGGATLSSRPLGFMPTSNSGTNVLYVGTQARLQASTEGGQYTLLSATLNEFTVWDFERFDDLVLATSYQNGAFLHTLGSASNFSTLGSPDAAPKASAIGIISQFVVLGNTNETVNGIVPHRIQWSGIDAPRSWPLPNSDTAVAQQAGEQFLNGGAGTVTAIVDADQYGLVFQMRAITRMTYIGPPAVFQFASISDDVGCPFPKSVIRVGGLAYFIATHGVFATDGVSIVPIGLGKVDAWLQANLYRGAPTRVIAAANSQRNLIYWSFPSASDGVGSDLLIYHWKEKRFSRASQANEGIVSVIDSAGSVAAEIGGFGAGFTQGSFVGTPGNAVFTTGETEPNPGGFARMQGIKPLVDVTANAITVAMGTRNDRSSAVSYTGEITANARSGFANFRSEARYHRARLTIAGTFNAAQGLEYEAVPSGYT